MKSKFAGINDLNISIDQIKNDNYIEELYPNIWIMSNHKWAYFVWEYYNLKRFGLPKILVHIDYHWDAINDFKKEKDVNKLLALKELDQIEEFIRENKLIKHDSFIAPAVIRGIFNEVYFLCRDYETEEGFDDFFVEKYKVKQYILKNVFELKDTLKEESIVLDLDLDYFNNAERFLEADLWPKDQIIKFLNDLSEVIKRASVICIALSYGYSGDDKADSYLYLLELLLDGILK